MNSSQTSSEAAAAVPTAPTCATKPQSYYGYPICPKPAPFQCGRCLQTQYCSAKHQKEHWSLHKKLCTVPTPTLSPIKPPRPSSHNSTNDDLLDVTFVEVSCAYRAW
ncbi:hypothetical protein TrLO_g14015 [Triparma laevis f. longispina]|uniref:MYND-type domain-containing protein n=1 Tax=Triparma laevis f. longispina TaxID=1714387 RepID=A0A9W7DTW3_9STRA|nr:hypothetical protein TrLO_g14015 [Triparma laevis f. longispina]